jgi:hypothetical protein
VLQAAGFRGVYQRPAGPAAGWNRDLSPGKKSRIDFHLKITIRFADQNRSPDFSGMVFDCERYTGYSWENRTFVETPINRNSHPNHKNQVTAGIGGVSRHDWASTVSKKR